MPLAILLAEDIVILKNLLFKKKGHNNVSNKYAYRTTAKMSSTFKHTGQLPFFKSFAVLVNDRTNENDYIYITLLKKDWLFPFVLKFSSCF